MSARPGSTRRPSPLARVGEWAYRAGSALVERWSGTPHKLEGAAVVSIGNLEIGGGGKTPCVLWWAETLAHRGAQVAVVCRPWGPRTPSGRSDEEALLAERLPAGVSLFAGRSKSEEALRARRAGATAVVVDDGFSHRALARDLDLVLVDARRPFGNGRCLPAGPLREPPEALARAHAVVLSRADRADAPGRRRAREQIRAAGFAGPILSACHRVIGVRLLGELVPAAGLAVYCASGLARAGELAQAAALAGLEVRGSAEFPDHHAFTDAEWGRVRQEASQRGARVLVTAKDAVRLSTAARAEALVLEIAWEWMEGDVEPDRLVDRLLAARVPA
jgi:tetraacyldisaccharide 4'-kinase